MVTGSSWLMASLRTWYSLQAFSSMWVIDFPFHVCAALSCVAEGTLTLMYWPVSSVHQGEDIPDHCLPFNTNMSFPKSALNDTNNSFQQVNSQSCIFFDHVWSHRKHWRLLGYLQCHKALWFLSETLKGAAQIMEDNEPLGEGGKPWNQKNFENFQNLQDQILDQGQCVSTGPACLSFVCFVCLFCVFDECSSLCFFAFDDRSSLCFLPLMNAAVFVLSLWWTLLFVFCLWWTLLSTADLHGRRHLRCFSVLLHQHCRRHSAPGTFILPFSYLFVSNKIWG